jgi:hypothetical protein
MAFADVPAMYFRSRAKPTPRSLLAIAGQRQSEPCSNQLRQHGGQAGETRARAYLAVNPGEGGAGLETASTAVSTVNEYM